MADLSVIDNTFISSPPIKLAGGEYADLYEMPNGWLRIQATEAGKVYLREQSEMIGDDDSEELRFNCSLWDFLEDILCNSEFEILNEFGGDYEAIGALTSAPIIAEWVKRDDFYNLLDAGRVWWFERYQIENELERVLFDGFVDFQLSK